MEEKRLIMIDDMCRLCLENAGAINLYETQDLVKDIYTSTAVNVFKRNNLPQKICKICYEIIHSVKNLRIVAMKSDSYLRSLFGVDIEDEMEDDLNLQDESNSSQRRETRSVFFAKDDASNINNDITSFTQNCERRPSSLKNQVLSVRKDIFESSVTMSPTRRMSTEDNHLPQQVPKLDQQVPRPIKLEKFKNDLECKVCHKIFETQKKLYLHQRLHFKNIMCPLDACGKKFATKGDLEKHIRTHTGERPYRCEICEKSFAQRGTLKAHRDALHGGEGYLLGK
ncbi:hypothetical protein O3G_MSEX014567 [Manduca sexta]|uniref:Uncharacterized protein n=1 Tax=Manduca sexta TaxID=7130 RepID=A0A922CZS7_MANSE|nr:hypothetical protein O3G_MSEX014567 [Manduca sexta]